MKSSDHLIGSQATTGTDCLSPIQLPCFHHSHLAVACRDFGCCLDLSRWLYNGKVRSKTGCKYTQSVRLSVCVFSRLMPKNRQEERKRALKKNNDAWCLIHQEKDRGSPCSQVSWSFATEEVNLENDLGNRYDAARLCNISLCVSIVF